MAEVEIRSYVHETDYFGLQSLLKETGLYDEDYESVERIAAAAQRHPDMITVAAIGERIVGSVYFQDGVIPQINRLAVRESQRMQGIGSRLLETAEQQARALGHKYIELFVNLYNPATQAFYAKRGYAEGDNYQNGFKRI